MENLAFKWSRPILLPLPFTGASLSARRLCVMRRRCIYLYLLLDSSV